MRVVCNTLYLYGPLIEVIVHFQSAVIVCREQEERAKICLCMLAILRRTERIIVIALIKPHKLKPNARRQQPTATLRSAVAVAKQL